MATAIHTTTPQILPGSPEWHEQRKLGIGGSEAAAMYSEGWGCARRLVMDKRGLPDDFVRTAREEAVLERGTELEDVVAEKFARETGLKIWRQNQPKVSEEFPHARVNIDRKIVGVTYQNLTAAMAKAGHDVNYFSGYFDDGDPGPGVLECKTTNEFDIKKLFKDGLGKDGLGSHPDYIFQIQHSLGVTGLRWGAFAFLEPTWWQFLWFPVQRDENLIAGILQQVERTWNLVEDPTIALPPSLPHGDKRCKSCLKRRSCRGDAYLEEMAGFKADSDYQEDSSPELVQIALDYRKAVENTEQATEVEEAIKEEFQQHMGERTKVSIPEAGIKINWTPLPGSNRWDGKAIEGEINKLKKEGQVELAARIEKCKKVSAPSRPWKKFAL